MKKIYLSLTVILTAGLIALQLQADVVAIANMTARAKMMSKNKSVGLHIHEKGDCSSHDAKSAGGHFAKVAPTGGTSKDFPGRYAGDLPSIKTDADGKSKGTFIVPDLVIISTMSSEHSIKDRAIIIHGGADNVNEQSAPRISCGKIEMRALAK